MRAEYKPLNLNFEGHALTLGLTQTEAEGPFFCTDGGLKKRNEGHRLDAGGRPYLGRACGVRLAKAIHLTGLAINARGVAVRAFDGICQPAFTEQ